MTANDCDKSDVATPRMEAVSEYGGHMGREADNVVGNMTGVVARLGDMVEGMDWSSKAVAVVVLVTTAAAAADNSPTNPIAGEGNCDVGSTSIRIGM